MAIRLTEKEERELIGILETSNRFRLTPEEIKVVDKLYGVLCKKYGHKPYRPVPFGKCAQCGEEYAGRALYQANKRSCSCGGTIIVWCALK